MSSISFFLFCFILLEGRKLLFVQEVFRHGARYPIFPHKEDDTTKYAEANLLGELTINGKHMHYILGKALANKYWSELFENNSYSTDQIYVHSTNVNRTLESVQAQLAGWLEGRTLEIIPQTMFNYSLPPFANLAEFEEIDMNKSAWEVFGKKDNGWTTVPIHTSNEVVIGESRANIFDEGDFLIKYLYENCPNQNFWRKENMASSTVKKIKNLPQVIEALKNLTNFYGTEVKYEKAYAYIDSFYIEKYLGKIPAQYFIESNKQIYNLILISSTIASFYGSSHQLRAVSTRLMKQTYENLENASKNKGQKLVLYSAHDTTILQLLTAFEFTSLDCLYNHFEKNVTEECETEYPLFAANIIFELYEEKGNYMIEILYNGKQMMIPFCHNTSCSLESMKKFVSDFAVADPNDMCGIRSQNIIFFVFIGIIGISFLAFFIAKIIKKISLAKKSLLENEYIEHIEEKDAEINNKEKN